MVAATTATSKAPAASAATFEAATPLRLRSGLIDRKIASIHGISVQIGNCLLSNLVRDHFDECKAP